MVAELATVAKCNFVFIAGYRFVPAHHRTLYSIREGHGSLSDSFAIKQIAPLL
jgi:hypothetical protein